MQALINFSLALYPQGFGIGLGYGTNKMLSGEIAFITADMWNIKFIFGSQIPNGTEGEYYDTINWDEFSEDHIKEGSYWSRIDLGIGKTFGNFYINGILGYAPKTLYRNCFDEFHILGDNGYYHKTVKGGGKINIGADLGVYIDKFYIGLDASTVGGINAKIGFIFL
ncbi:MAG: hypothetical protein U9N72_04905 [Bacteroidota bacterium]|nr:hypothetical protein [Bacteroidota bacterium]